MNEQIVALFAIVITFSLFGGAAIRCGYTYHVKISPHRDFLTGVMSVISGMMWLLLASWILCFWIWNP